jgi:hypothetical protein
MFDTPYIKHEGRPAVFSMPSCERNKPLPKKPFGKEVQKYEG